MALTDSTGESVTQIPAICIESVLVDSCIVALTAEDSEEILQNNILPNEGIIKGTEPLCVVLSGLTPLPDK